MKSVLKAVAPVAMTITFALSGIAMADTATESPKSADATAITKETVKPSVHKHHEASKKIEESKDVKSVSGKEQASAKEVAAPATSEKAVSVEKNPAEKSTTVATVEKTAAKIEPGKTEQKKVEPVKTN